MPSPTPERAGQNGNSRGASLVKQGSILSLLTLGSRIAGLVREMVKAALLGTSPLSDAFSVAFMIPNLFRRLFAEGSIAVAFIPTFKGYLIEDNKEKTKDFLSSFITLLTFLVTLVVLLGIALTPLLVPIFSLKELNETILLTQIMFPFLALISFAAFLQGILNSHSIFAPSGFAPIVLNVVIILCSYGLSPLLGNPARAMAVGVLIGGTLQCLIQWPAVYRLGYRISFSSMKKAFTNPGTRTVLRLVGPTIVGMAAYQLNDLVSTALAGRAGPGVVSSLQYSLRLQELFLGIFAVSIGTVLLPDLAGYAKKGQWAEYNQRLITAMDIIALITIPVTIFSLQQGEVIIRLLFQANSFNEESVALTKNAFTYHIVGLFFIAINRILAPAFYAQSDSKSPTLAGILSFFVNMILAALLVGPMKGGGVALALTLASMVNTVFLLLFLRRNPQVAVGRAVASALGYTTKLAVFSGLAVLPLVWLSPRLLSIFQGRGRLIGYGMPLLINTLVFGVIGAALLVLSKDKQALYIAKSLKRRF
ncbi:murein biosynthesis integral membrane protein MurJ [Gracilinema caldarium]|nr:murein biosynthesis integral membrane protein MurJ [Gracilinema caldarium]